MTTIYRELRQALDWFRFEWQADLPAKLHESAVHVDDHDHLGGPAMTDRFRDYISSGVMWVDGERWMLEPPKGKVRQALCAMSGNSPLERRAAHFLFVLACLDFEPDRAGLSLVPPLLPEYSHYYAEKAIARIAQVMSRRESHAELPWQMSGQYRLLEKGLPDKVSSTR